MRSPAAHPGGVPVTLTGGLTLGRSNSPAGTSRAPTNYPPSGLTQRVLAAPTDHAGQVRYVPNFPPNSSSPYSQIRDRDLAAVYMSRPNVSKKNVYFIFTNICFVAVYEMSSDANSSRIM